MDSKYKLYREACVAGFSVREALEYAGLPARAEYWERIADGDLPPYEEVDRLFKELAIGPIYAASNHQSLMCGTKYYWRTMKAFRREVRRRAWPMAVYEAVRHTVRRYINDWEAFVDQSRYEDYIAHVVLVIAKEVAGESRHQSRD